MAQQPKHRAYVSNFVISLGFMEVTGDLIPPKATNAGREERFTSICPDPSHSEPKKVNQFYQCEDGHGPYGITDCGKAQEVNGQLVAIDKDQIVAAKGSTLPPNQLEVSVHRASDVRDHTIGSGVSYIFRPSGSGNAYGILLDFLADHDDVVLLGRTNIRKTEKLVRLTVSLNNQLVVEELVWPEDLKAFDTPEYEIREGLYPKAETFIESSVSDWDVEVYKKESRARVRSLVESAVTGTPVTQVPALTVTKTDSDDALEALLDAAIADKKKKSA